MTMPPASRFVSEVSLEIRRDTDVQIAQLKSKQFASTNGCSAQVCWKVAIVVSEAASNIVKFAGHGTILLRTGCTQDDTPFIEMIAKDNGPGIDNLELAIRDGFSENRDLSKDENVLQRRGLGSGIGAMLRLADKLKINRPDEGGTEVIARFFC